MRDTNLVNALRLKCGGGKKMERDVIGAMRTAFEQSADRIVAAEEYALVLKKEIEKLRAQLPRWIPVEERLPEVWRNDETAELVNYMICSPDFGVDIGNYHAEAKKWLCMALPCTVTHWMPLPEPPEVKL